VSGKAIISLSCPQSRSPAEAVPQGYSVKDLCRRWKVGQDKVYGFIRRGELVGVNVAANLSRRPQWRFTLKAVEDFERRRTSAPPPEPTRRRRRKVEEVDYYPD
jgi:Helix-turn-helix domain